MKAEQAARNAAQAGSEHLHQAADAAVQGLRGAAKGLRSAAGAAGEELSEAGAAAARGTQDLLAQCSQSIRQHPLAAFGIAFAAGVVISRLLRR